MPVNSYIFTYNNTNYIFNARPLEDDRFYKIQFLNPVDNFGLPQQFLLNTSLVLVFLPEEPNALYYTTKDARAFLKSFSADLQQYMLEFA